MIISCQLQDTKNKGAVTSLMSLPFSSQILSQRLSQSVGLSSHGDQDEEMSITRGTEMATNTITVLSRYGYYGYKSD